MKRTLRAIFLMGLALVFTNVLGAQTTDPLPSWNDGEGDGDEGRIPRIRAACRAHCHI